MAEVEFAEWTRTRTLRAPSFKGLRDDIDPAADRPRGGGERRRGGARARAVRCGPAQGVGAGRGRDRRPHPVALEPRQGHVPGGRVHARARSSTTTPASAPTVLPHLRDRPLTLKRYPDGVDGEYFYEKQSPVHRPAWVQTAALWSRHNKRTIDYTLAQDLPDARVAGQPGRHRAAHVAVAGRRRRRSRRCSCSTSTRARPPAVLECAQVALWVRDLFGQLGLETLRRRRRAPRACRPTSR